MSQLHQLSFQQPLFREKQNDRLAEHLQRHEASLLSELFGRNGRKSVVQTATPPDYIYVLDDPVPRESIDANGIVMQIAAHPGDGPDFFYATHLNMITNTTYRYDYHE